MAAPERGELTAEHYLACAYDVRHEILVVFDHDGAWWATCLACKRGSTAPETPTYRLGPEGLTRNLSGDDGKPQG